MMPTLPGIALETKSRRPIRNYQRLEQSAVHLKTAIDMFVREHPSARLRSATGCYNCFGMVFASRRTCIDALEGTDIDRDIEMILHDDDYRRLRQGELPEQGDVVLYRDRHDSISHAAIIVNVTPTINPEILVMSQWGANGEYFHRIDDVYPMLGNPREYWTDRRNPP